MHRASTVHHTELIVAENLYKNIYILSVWGTYSLVCAKFIQAILGQTTKEKMETVDVQVAEAVHQLIDTGMAELVACFVMNEVVLQLRSLKKDEAGCASTRMAIFCKIKQEELKILGYNWWLNSVETSQRDLRECSCTRAKSMLTH